MSGFISLEGTASAFPDRVLGNDYFGTGTAEQSETQKKMFLGTKTRRHIAREETSVDLFERAARRAADELGLDLARDVDMVVTNVSIPEVVWTGAGAPLAQRLGIRPKLVLDLHNGGCVAFLMMASYAESLMRAHGLKRVLLAIAQTAAGRCFSHEEIRKMPQSAIPGDGAGVAFLTLGGDSPLTPIVQRCHPESATDMKGISDDGHLYWEPSLRPFYLDFADDKISTILRRGSRIVPEAMRAACAAAGIRPRDLDGLVTNQPNPYFLRNWREAMELPKEKQFETFEEYGNLFQAGIPVCLDRAIRDGRLRAGHRVMIAGFSHAGDFSAAGILHYKGTA